MSEQIIELNENVDPHIFYGVNNQNIICLRNMHPQVRVIARDYTVKATGSDEEILRFETDLRKVERFCLEHNTLTQDIIIELIKGGEPQGFRHDNLILHGVNGKSILARTQNQQKLLADYDKCDLMFAIGPAGSGKTYVAIALAVRALKNKEVRKIILSRPAVEAGEKLGFLPGDMKEKIDPYLQPLYDALEDMIPQAKLQEYMEKGVIQIAPLAFMRGRTLSEAVVILDEAQNTTVPQIKMFLTRLGMGSKMIVTGDLTQIDLPLSQRSGLKDACDVLNGIPGISFVRFNEKDIVRHPLVERIVKAYDKPQNKEENKKGDK
uniref:PhoH-like protein n=1 Tax=uncultured bacterium fosmid pJB102C1 TaxID=1478050 RepID=A0A0H3UAU9_9BACT|nr:putative phoh family protein [uncultured bacterium fosmid pJB102C1]